MPTWASWDSQDVFLPADFHSKKGAKAILDYLKSLPTEPPLTRNALEQLLLLLGLTAREVWRSVEMHEGMPEANSPEYLKKNPLATEHDAHQYLKVLYEVSPFHGFKEDAPKGVKRRADGNPSGARYVIPQCLSQVIETVT
jgi:hypothetical protein